MQHLETSISTDSRPIVPAGDAGTDDPEIVIARLRNYDYWEGHSVRLSVVSADGEVVYSGRRYLAPEQAARVSGLLSGGTYELRVWIDGVERTRRTCRIEATPSGTAVVELGNGVVSVTPAGSSSSSTG